jgi:hypothetical protein
MVYWREQPEIDRMDSIWGSNHVVMDLVVIVRQLSLACMVVIWVVTWMHGYSRCFSMHT